METYEKLGAFYLGKIFDEPKGEMTDDMVLYDAKDLTTHAVCVGMTGSGKTGLCVTLLEEAAIDGIPAIAIDPKGDLGNLLLTFPELRPADFRPWIDEREAQRKDMTPDEYAANRAELWRKGLGKWGQGGDRIKRFRDAVDITIYTPGSNAGVPITVLRSFNAPPPELRADSEALRERVGASVSGLLALLGIDADPIRSREHILLSTIIDRAWRAGRDMDVATLINAIQAPPFETIGVMDLESFFPSKDRFELAMALNNLLASPGFAGWMEGEPLDIGRLMYTPEGKPRISILSIAHLSEAERMFFVTILLNELVAWMRTQSGTSSLRALLYMDEIFGFFPPSRNPPSKIPMLTLLKQARAYGLGVVLATQNPVDLDYKGLSNTGTWFIGRLQTERDKMRVLEGLEGASNAAGSTFDRGKMEATLAGLGSRVFLLNNVHEDGPVLFHTRWAMSYLRGPLTRAQIQELMKDRVAQLAASPSPSLQPVATANATPGRPFAPATNQRPAVAAPPDDGLRPAPPPLPGEITQRFLPITSAVAADDAIVYRPAVVGVCSLHYVRRSAGVDDWVDVSMLAELDGEAPTDPWEDAEMLSSADPSLDRQPHERGRFVPVPGPAARATTYRKWSKKFVDHLYRNRAVTILQCRALKQFSEPDQSPGEFRVSLRQLLHEKRDEELEKLRKKYTPKLATMEDRIRRAEERVEREKAQFKQAGLGTAISMGATVLGALFGRKKASVGNVGRAASTMRGAGRTAREKGDIRRAEENVESVRDRMAALQREFEEEIEEVREETDLEALEFEEIVLRPTKTHTSIKTVALAWAPYRIGAGGMAEALFDFGGQR